MTRRARTPFGLAALCVALAAASAPGADDKWDDLPNGVRGRLAGFDGVGGVKVAGYVRTPAGPGPFPLVIVLHGGAPTARAVTGDTAEERATNAVAEAERAGKQLGRASHPPLPD